MTAITDRIDVNPRVMLGKPVIRGTRIPVELILRKLTEGAPEVDLLDAYPHLTRRDLEAAVQYGTRPIDGPLMVLRDARVPYLEDDDITAVLEFAARHSA